MPCVLGRDSLAWWLAMQKGNSWICHERPWQNAVNVIAGMRTNQCHGIFQGDPAVPVQKLFDFYRWESSELSTVVAGITFKEHMVLHYVVSSCLITYFVHVFVTVVTHHQLEATQGQSFHQNKCLQSGPACMLNTKQIQAVNTQWPWKETYQKNVCVLWDKQEIGYKFLLVLSPLEVVA